MKEFENIVFGKACITSLALTVILMVSIPVVLFVYWRRKHKPETKISWLIAGAMGFIISARVLELGVHYFCIIADNPISRFINGNTAAYVLYGTLMAGVFEECGRHVVMKYVMKKNRTRENAVLYGIGHGGIEILAVMLPTMILSLAAALLFSSGDTETALRTLNITEETAAAALPTVQAAASFGFGTAALNVLERLFAMFLHIGLSVIVYHGVAGGKKGYLPLAILLHMLMDTFPAIYQRGLLPLWAVELWIAAWVAVTAAAALRSYRKIGQDFE